MSRHSRGFSSSPPAAAIAALVRRQLAGDKYTSLFSAVVSSPTVLSLAALHLLRRSHPSALHALPPLPGPLSVASADDFSVLHSSRLKGTSIVVPSLSLKITLVAIRLALSAVFASGKQTFAYPCRHQAVRYLKNYPKNPSWWFPVKLKPQQSFAQPHIVERLGSVIAKRVDDPQLIWFIKEVIRSGAVDVRVGGGSLELGRGFPQESEIAGLLVDVYFDAVDKEVMKIREEVRVANPRIRGVSHTPVRVYGVRYMDEILVVTSGSKRFTLEVMDQIVKVVEQELGLEVEKLDTAVHSAVCEKVEFLGFEFQAVVPSVLHPPLSEKALRARKKWLKAKEAGKQEMKNARETRRKKLGLEILGHLFKKVKLGNIFEFHYQIEDEVSEIFRGWADETAKEYFDSQENRWFWHRMLSSGDFLSLRRVRDQLPPVLVESYDRFQEALRRHLMPVRASKVIMVERKQEEEEDDRRYEEKIVKDLMELKMRVNAPIELIRKSVKLAGFTNSMGRPRPIKLLLCLDDADIVKWFAGVAWRWLDFYCCCRNFKAVKTVVNYHLRFSCFLTLAEKHGSTKRQSIAHYTKYLKVFNDGGTAEIFFPTEREIRMMGDKELSTNPKPVDGALSMILARLAVVDSSNPCLTNFCLREDTTLFRIRLLQNRLNVDPLNEERWVHGMGAIHESLNKKVVSLCSMHVNDLLLGRITLQDIDCTKFVEMD